MSGPVVFLVFSHHKPALTERLLARLADTESAITVLHHDPEGDVAPGLPSAGRALRVSDPIHMEWGAPTTIGAELRAIRWTRSEVPDFSWMVVISAQDYPAMSPRDIEAELLASQADAFMRWEFTPPFARRRSTDWQRGTSHRYYWRVAPGTTRPVPVPRVRSYFDGLGVFAGSNWANLGRRAVERMFEDEDRLERVRRRFRRTMIPDETVFQTLLMNAPAGLHIACDDRRYYRFPKTGGSAHPRTLTIDDLDEIVASGAFFARKVDLGASDELLDRLDALHARVRPGAGA